MRANIQRSNRNRKVPEIRSDSLLGDYVSVLQDCTSAHITRYPKEITMYQSDNTRNMLKRSLGSFCMPGTLSALKLQAQLVRAAYPTTSESTSTRNLACNSERATITGNTGLSMCAGAASSGGIAVTAPQESHSDCCPQPGSGGAPASGHPETGRKLGTHGLQIGKAVAAAPAESHPADSVPGNHRSGLAEVLTCLLNQSHEATLLSCHPEREISANQHF